MVSNQWVSTWKKSALQAAGLEPTPFALKALSLWSKSTPMEPWTKNPIGIPAKGYYKRIVPGTPYALFLTYSDFSKAFTTALDSESGGYIKLLLNDGKSIAKLWRAIHELNWPGATTENDYPREIHYWIGDDLREKMNIPPATPHRSSGTTTPAHITHQQVLATQRAMITAHQTKQDLHNAILFITRGVK
jgi:hypothetical protein